MKPRTVSLAAAAYFSKSLSYALTHSYVDGAPSTLCRNAKSSSVLDDPFATDENAAPTCPICLKRDARFAAEVGS